MAGRRCCQVVPIETRPGVSAGAAACGETDHEPRKMNASAAITVFEFPRTWDPVGASAGRSTDLGASLGPDG